MEKKVGTITHFYPKICVGIVKLKSDLEKGNKVRFKGNTTDFEQDVQEMQFDHKDIESGAKGQEVGVKVIEQVREGDEVLVVG